MSDAGQELLDRMRAAPDRKSKAEIAGLIREPGEIDGDKASCELCMYFLNNHAWCDLPELDMSVDPDWYCQLWRI